MIQTGTDERNRKLDLKELEGVIGGADTGEDTRSVSCSVCGCKFSIPEGRTSAKCPDCGATVYKKK